MFKASAGFLAALLIFLLVPPTQAQVTRFDGLRGCERLAAVQFKKRNPSFRRFRIDRTNVTVDRHNAMVGNQFVMLVYSGKASYDAGAGRKSVHFICLHGGIGQGPLFVYTISDQSSVTSDQKAPF